MKKTLKVFKYIFTLRWFFEGLVWFYKKCISPILPKSCIYTPSCSNYMLEAIKEFGVIRGVGLGTKRLLKCSPLFEGGVDPVPDNPRGDIKWLIF